MRFTLRPLNPAGLELIKAVEPTVPAFSVTDRELDVYVSDRSELERVLAKFTPQWRQVVEVERAEYEGADSEQ